MNAGPWIASCRPVDLNGACNVPGHLNAEGVCANRQGKLTTGKRPILLDWVNRGVADRELLPAGFNPGLLCGPEHDRLVVDADTPEEVAVVESWGWGPPRKLYRSGSPGALRYEWPWPEGLEAVPDRLDGIKILGAGRYMVAEGGLHRSGVEIAIIAETPDAQLPEHAVARMADTFAATGRKAPRSGPRAAPRAVERMARPDMLHPRLVKLLDQVAPDPRPSRWTWNHIVTIVIVCKQLGLDRDRVKMILQSDEHAIRHAEGHFDHKAGYWYDNCLIHPQEHVGRLCSASTGCKLDSGWLEEEALLAGEHLRDLVVPALARKGEISVRDLRRGPFHAFSREDPYRASAEWVERVVALGAESGVVDRGRVCGGGKGGRPSTHVRLCAKTSDGGSGTPSDLRKREPAGLQIQKAFSSTERSTPTTHISPRSTVSELIVNAAPKSFQNGQGLCAKTSECINVRCDRAGVVQSPVTGCWLCPTHAGEFGYPRRSA